MSRKEKRIVAGLILIYCLTLAYSFLINYEKRIQSPRFNMTFVAIICPLIIPLLFKILKWKPVFEISVVNLVFCYFASLIGSCLGGYSTVYFDKIMHFGFGFIGIEIAMLLYCYLKKTVVIKSGELSLFVVFINAINLSMAALWEFYEYAILVLFNNDAINHYTSGVHDSMGDMIVCMLGGLIVTGILYRSYKKQQTNFFVNLTKKFYQINQI